LGDNRLEASRLAKRVAFVRHIITKAQAVVGQAQLADQFAAFGAVPVLTG